MTKMILMPVSWLALSITLIFSSSGHAGWLDENMIDPEDGKLDVSNYLASANGFLPVPIIITEPAVGYGLGAAIAYFHQPKEIDRDEQGTVLCLSVCQLARYSSDALPRRRSGHG